MTGRCPKCGYHADDQAGQVEELAEAVRRAGHRVTPDMRITEAAAADLLGLAAATVKNWRGMHRPLPFVKVGGRATYRLRDLAEYLARDED